MVRRSGLAFAATLLAALLAVAVAAPVAARNNQTIRVGCQDDRVARLIGAINAANSSPASTDTVIYLSAACQYTLYRANNFPSVGANGLPIIHRHIVIHGQDASLLRGGSARFRFFEVAANGWLKIRDLTLSNGRVRNGLPGANSTDGDGLDGADGKNGGAIYNLGKLQLDHATFSYNQAGDGGAGGFAEGSDQPTAGAGANGADAPNLTGGNGGKGGDGGAIYSSGWLQVVDSAFEHNQAGAGGPGGHATGGDGGNGGPGVPGGNGGRGGGALGGESGNGGDGGAIWATSSSPISINGTQFLYNVAGAAPDSGNANAGDGGDGANNGGNGGDGGAADSFANSSGGTGGAAFFLGSSVLIDSTDVEHNTAGNGGHAFAAGGAGGMGGCEGNGGAGGNGSYGIGVGGINGGFHFNGGHATTTNSTFLDNNPGSDGSGLGAGGLGGSGGAGCF